MVSSDDMTYIVKRYVYVSSTKNFNNKNMFMMEITSQLANNLYFLNFKQEEDNIFYYIYCVHVYDADVLQVKLQSALSEYLVDGYERMYKLKNEQLFPLWRSAVRRHAVEFEKTKNDGRIRCGESSIA